MIPPPIVTLPQVQAHLNLPDAPDADLAQKMAAATAFVCQYVAARQPPDPAWTATIEAWTPETAPPEIVLAVLEHTADLFRYRGDDGDGDKLRDPGFLPRPIRNLLVQYRDPVVG